MFLIQACKDRDGGNSGAASKALTQFRKEDFSNAAKDSLFFLLKTQPYYIERVIRLTGFAGVEGSKKYLEETYIYPASARKKTEWAARLALARMGDSTSLAYCLEKVKSEPVNDKVVYYLFPDLVYTRQEAGIRYMLGAIQSDAKNCTSSNPYSEENIICAFRIMELIAPVILNFPLHASDDGELEIEDFDEALKTVREWIKSDPGLQLNKNFY
jgi:hypothetical protein